MNELEEITVQYRFDEQPGTWPCEERFDHSRPQHDRLFFVKGIDLTDSKEFNPDPVMHPLWEHNMAWRRHVSRCPSPESGIVVQHSILAILETFSKLPQGGRAATPLASYLDRILPEEMQYEESIEEEVVEQEESREVEISDVGTFDTREPEMTGYVQEITSIGSRRSMDPVETPDSPRSKRSIDGAEGPSSPFVKRRKSTLSLEMLSSDVSRDHESPTELISSLSIQSRSEGGTEIRRRSTSSTSARRLIRSQSCSGFTFPASENLGRPSLRRRGESQITPDSSSTPPVLEDVAVDSAQLLPSPEPVASSSALMQVETQAYLHAAETSAVLSENTLHIPEVTMLSEENDSNLPTVTASSPTPSLRPRHSPTPSVRLCPSPTPSTSQRSTYSFSSASGFTLGGSRPISPVVTAAVATSGGAEVFLPRRDYLPKRNSEKFKDFIKRIKQDTRRDMNYRKCVRVEKRFGGAVLGKEGARAKEIERRAEVLLSVEDCRKQVWSIVHIAGRSDEGCRAAIELMAQHLDPGWNSRENLIQVPPPKQGRS